MAALERSFEAGPLGLVLGDRDGVVKVISVDAASQVQDVPVGAIVCGVSGATTDGLNKAAVIALIKAANRPLMIKFGAPALRI